jgi:signal peptidase I
VPISNVVGVAFVTVWPIERAGLLHNPAKTFADVPAPTATS